MSAQLQMFDPQTSKVLLNAISSPESADGRLHFLSPDGQQTSPSGLSLVPASRSVKQAKGFAKKTNATSGLLPPNSSASAILQSALANRLQARLGVNGSLEYALTWKEWDMQLGGAICALRASARRISAKDYTGWLTPKLPSGGGCERNSPGGGLRKLEDQCEKLVGGNTPRATDGSNGGPNQAGGALSADAALCGWVSPTAQDGSRGSLPPRPQDTGIPLSQQVAFTGWATPTVQDSANNAGPSQFRRNSLPLNCEVTLTRGELIESSTARMGNPGAFLLNPNFSRWLMGFPTEWGCCGATAMLSFLR